MVLVLEYLLVYNFLHLANFTFAWSVQVHNSTYTNH